MLFLNWKLENNIVKGLRQNLFFLIFLFSLDSKQQINILWFSYQQPSYKVCQPLTVTLSCPYFPISEVKSHAWPYWECDFKSVLDGASTSTRLNLITLLDAYLGP